MVVETGTANRAFAKGGGCPTVRQPLSPGPEPPPRLIEPPLLCQPLTPLIGRQATLSTPQPRKISPAPPVARQGAQRHSAESSLMSSQPGHSASMKSASRASATRWWPSSTKCAPPTSKTVMAGITPSGKAARRLVQPVA